MLTRQAAVARIRVLKAPGGEPARLHLDLLLAHIPRVDAHLGEQRWRGAAMIGRGHPQIEPPALSGRPREMRQQIAVGYDRMRSEPIERLRELHALRDAPDGRAVRLAFDVLLGEAEPPRSHEAVADREAHVAVHRPMRLVERVDDVTEDGRLGLLDLHVGTQCRLAVVVMREVEMLDAAALAEALGLPRGVEDRAADVAMSHAGQSPVP